MATVRVETVLSVPDHAVWEAVADVGAVHERLLPGRVAAVRMDGDTRVLTMPDGWEVRELIVAVDHDQRRLAYAVVEGQRLPLTYHHASFQVFPEPGGSRLVWTTDVLPHPMAAAVEARVSRGIEEIKQVLEAAQGVGNSSSGRSFM
ncbi:SRPBCC family protein [Actinoplanes subglobosus]|uniref:SRPBCC family protein n=1 Tax=Actinoplanes subglobosus TaxID=1547892 RepID=A0ABV8J1P0_9ACTN